MKKYIFLEYFLKNLILQALISVRSTNTFRSWWKDPQSNAAPELVLLNVYRAQELGKASIPPAYVAWRTGTITLFLLGA